MSEDILVVEYEPRYTERVRAALAGQAFNLIFAKDGEEALHAIESKPPRLVVLSSVIPKIGTGELIRVLRGRGDYQNIPILLTVSGYNGRNPKADAVRLGASDILPKPYTEADFLTKTLELMGIEPVPALEVGIAGGSHPSPRPASLDAQATVKLTSSEIFGDVLEEERTSGPVKKAPRRQTDDVDKMLADTLSGVWNPRKGAGDAKSSETTANAAEARAKGQRDLDKRLQDSLSGLEKNVRAPRAAVPPAGPAARSAVPFPVPAGPADGNPLPFTDDVPAMSPLILPAEKERFVEDEPFEESDSDDGQRFGPYVLLEKIATGGMAEVWKARRRGVEGFQKIVAIKKILPHLSDNEEFIEMFIDEAKLAAQLNHNNIIHIYDLGKIVGSYYIAMELIDGHDLKSILKSGEERQQPMAVETALFIATKIASALDYAHRKRDFDEKEMGLVHRDVSPQNVLISHEGDIKLCDFGIAKAASKASHTQAGALKGKLQYMSPEQAWGRKIDRRSDIFALAAVLFEMLTSRKLFAGENEMSVLEQVREARVQAPSILNEEVSSEVDAIVLRALSKEPEERYQTAGEFARDLDAVLYSFRPTPTSADLAIYMHRLYSEAPPATAAAGDSGFRHRDAESNRPALAPEGTPEKVVAVAPVAFEQYDSPSSAPPAGPLGMMHGASSEDKRKAPLLPIAAGVLLAVAAGGFFLLRKAPAPAPVIRAPQPSAPPVTAQAPGPLSSSSTMSPLPVSSGTTATAVTGLITSTDQQRIEEEVKRRLESERAKLAEKNVQRSVAADARDARATASQPPPSPQVQAPTTSAQPIAQPPPPVTPAQTEAVAPPMAAPEQVSAPAQTRAREGDLVEVGTEGLTPPRLLRRFMPPYPPLAKIQRVEGLVVLSALVSETGRVLEVRILRGVPVLNDAATEAIRKSSFAPATKDGVRVKSRATLTVPFKL